MTDQAEKHTILILGGGIAGIELAGMLSGRTMNGKSLAATLVDREWAHIWKPMLHTIAAGTEEAQLQQTSYIAQARDHGFAFQPGEVVEIDPAARAVTLAPLTFDGEELASRRRLTFDTLILALGSRADDFGTPGAHAHASRIDSRGQAILFNEEIRRRLMRAAVAGDTLQIGIVGGGATGVELAAELVRLGELVRHYGADLPGASVEVTLVERGARLLAAFPEKVSSETLRKLEAIGVRVRLNTGVQAVEPDALVFQNRERQTVDMTVWAAGVRAADVVAGIESLERHKSGQVVIAADMRTSNPAVFALGDCSSLTPPGDARPLAATAQVAHQQASWLGRHLPALLEGRTVPAFRYRDFGALVTLGGYDAYGSLGRFGFFDGFIRGRVAQLGHAFLYRSHQARLHGFWRGGLLWLSDVIAARVRPRIRLD